MNTLFLMALACKPPLIEVSASASPDVVTVITVSWDAGEGVTAAVEYGPTQEMMLSTELTPEGEAILLGLAADQLYHFRLVAEDGQVLSSEHSIQTGTLPGDLPSLELVGDPGAWDGFLLTSILGNTNTAVIISPEGEIVWYKAMPDHGRVIRARPRRDGTGLLFGTFSIPPGSNPGIHSTTWTGETLDTLFSGDFNHDFVQLQDGSILALTYAPQEQLGRTVIGDKIVRLWPDQSSSVLWSVWDDLVPTADQDLGGTWTHANSLNLGPEEDKVWIGLRNLSSIAQVDIATQSMDWLLGDNPSADLPIHGDDAFSMQHQFKVLDDDGLLVFDNHLGTDGPSRVIEYKIDHQEVTVDLEWEHHHDPEFEVVALGDVARLADGNTFITWSTSGELQLVSPASDVLWQLNTGVGFAFGYAELLPPFSR
jgi:hypothetical protein